MDSDVSDDYQASDAELDDNSHKKLIENVLNLSRKEHVKKPSRTEPTLAISEYDLVESNNKVQVSKLTKVLNKKTAQSKILKTIKKIRENAKTIKKPLEKPEADRIRRSVAYDITQEELKKWEPIVTSFQAATTLKFPLETDIQLKDQPVSSQWRLKSDLQKKLDEIDPPVEIYTINPEPDQFPLTLQEMKEKRMEAAKMRAEQSYREAKARREGKIKSKKFHRIKKREKVKKQLKDFELLQKTDPEAALSKLEEIEKARALERVSLRHKSTGKWAQNKQIRAKYDKESRQILAQQLAISRDLTQKIKNTNSDSEPEDEMLPVNTNQDPSNPWTNPNLKVSKEVNQFVNGYRKYWEEKNNKSQNEGVEEEYEENIGNKEVNGDVKEVIRKKKVQGNMEKIKKVENGSSNEEDVKKKISKISFKTNKIKGKLKEIKKVDPDLAPSCPKEKSKKVKEKPTSVPKIGKKKNKVKNVSLGTTGWDVKNLSLEQEFAKIGESINMKLKEKYDNIKGLLNENLEEDPTTKVSKKPQKEIDLKLYVEAKRPKIDEPLNEFDYNNKSNQAIKNQNLKSQAPTVSNGDDIDPKKFIAPKTVTLNSQIPDLITYEENEPEGDQQAMIAEAFADDDIVEDFHKDKKSAMESSKITETDLSLPGWGSWAGTEVKPRTKPRRFITRAPKYFPRKDQNKGNLIVNDAEKSKYKQHLVNEVPFPFTTVKDYEASIRLPIGNTFVPEKAHRKLIAAKVTTQMGAIIKPMDSDILLKVAKEQSV